MSEQEAIEILRAYYEPNNRKQNEAMDMAIKALGTDGDLIDRQAAIYIASGYCHPANIAKELAKLPSAQPEIIRCKDCIHKPTTTPDYNFDNGDCGFEIEFPDYRCPCQCDDGWYNRLPEDDWFCGNAERREDG